jgi:ribosomal protein S8
MTSNNEYLKKILQQILESRGFIENLTDKSGDLELVKVELLKIIGVFSVLVKKLGTENFQSNELSELKSKITNYLENYYFIQEIDTMSSLYSDDSDRLKNIRFKILASFEDKKLIDKIEGILEKL